MNYNIEREGIQNQFSLKDSMAVFFEQTNALFQDVRTMTNPETRMAEFNEARRQFQVLYNQLYAQNQAAFDLLQPFFLRQYKDLFGSMEVLKMRTRAIASQIVSKSFSPKDILPLSISAFDRAMQLFEMEYKAFCLQ